MDTRTLGLAHCLCGSLDIPGIRSRQSSDGDTLRAPCDVPHRLEVTGRCRRKPSLDYVNLESNERFGNLKLLGGGKRRAWRLLAVAKRGVKNNDTRLIDTYVALPVAHDSNSSDLMRSVCSLIARRHCRLGVFSRGLAGLEPRHHRAEVFADALDIVVRARLPHGQEILAARFVLGDPFTRERAILNLAKERFHRLLGVSVDDLR